MLQASVNYGFPRIITSHNTIFYDRWHSFEKPPIVARQSAVYAEVDLTEAYHKVQETGRGQRVEKLTTQHWQCQIQPSRNSRKIPVADIELIHTRSAQHVFDARKGYDVE
ncbi:hypothetical protein EVAR_54372_1 [Eumeta japonica]|uniref:Uncharacterized protein n=1 Tax=Eumeta variegata TaxID=151549 RepID=A0A4C1Y5E4_EUMVA|nr:hypothetical protein EVAR_54372_1 [Eumeta japonica]